MDNRRLIVSKIKDGIVIDHLPPGRGMIVLAALQKYSENSGFDLYSKRIVLLINTDSTQYIKKDILKSEGLTELPPDVEVVIALLRPHDPPTVNIIKNYEVVKKYKPQLPKSFSTYFLKCPHPNCITNDVREQKHFGVHVHREFEVIEYEKEIYLRCPFCNTIITLDEIQKLIG